MPESRNPVGRVLAIALMLASGIAGYFLFTNLSVRQADSGLQTAYRSLALNIILVAAALAGGRLPVLFLNVVVEERLAPTALALGYVLAGFGMWRGLAAFSGEVSVMSGIGLVCLAGAIALAVCHLAVYAQRRKFGGVFSGIFDWLVNARSYAVIIVMCGAVYAFIARPLFISKLTYSVLMEWIIILLLGILVLGITRFRIGRNFIEEETVTEPNWRQHQQKIDTMTDSDYNRVRRLERRFIEESDQTMLAYFLASLLARNGVSENSISTVLTPLIEYRERNVHNWMYRNKKGPVQTERERLMKNTVMGMQSSVQPSRYSRGSGQTKHSADSPLEARQKTVSDLAEAFYKKGDCSSLLVRLSLLLASAETRDEDVYEVLQPLMTHRNNSRVGRSERERLWQDVAVRVARYAPKVSLKE